jgi:hypothetical protein
MEAAHMAPPSGYAPSDVKSAKSRKWNGIMMAYAMIASIRPCSTPFNIRSIVISNLPIANPDLHTYGTSQEGPGS